MTPKKYFQMMVANIVQRSGIARPTVEAVLPAVFDEIRYQLCQGERCVPIESFGNIAVVDIPERQRRYTYGGRDEIRTLPPKKRIKFAPTRNLRREVDNGLFDPSRRSFSRHPHDPAIRARSHMAYNPRKQVYIGQVQKNSNHSNDTKPSI